MIMHTSVLSWAYLVLLFLLDAPKAIWLVLFLPDTPEAVWLVFVCFRLTLLRLNGMCCLFCYFVFRLTPPWLYGIYFVCFRLTPPRLNGICVVCFA